MCLYHVKITEPPLLGAHVLTWIISHPHAARDEPMCGIFSSYFSFFFNLKCTCYGAGVCASSAAFPLFYPDCGDPALPPSGVFSVCGTAEAESSRGRLGKEQAHAASVSHPLSSVSPSLPFSLSSHGHSSTSSQVSSPQLPPPPSLTCFPPVCALCALCHPPSLSSPPLMFVYAPPPSPLA